MFFFVWDFVQAFGETVAPEESHSPDWNKAKKKVEKAVKKHISEKKLYKMLEKGRSLSEKTPSDFITQRLLFSSELIGFHGKIPVNPLRRFLFKRSLPQSRCGFLLKIFIKHIAQMHQRKPISVFLLRPKTP